MPSINLCPSLNETVADLLLGCEDNGLELYAGTYIKDLERQLAEYHTAEEQENIIHIPVDEDAPVYSIEYCCGNDGSRIGMCFRGLCRDCEDGKLYILEATAKETCQISELGKSVFLSCEAAERALEKMKEGKKNERHNRRIHNGQEKNGLS